MCFNSAYKVILCLLRRFVSLNDKINAPIAGFVSALTLLLDIKSRRMLMAVLLVSRCGDTTLNIAEKNGIIPKIKKREVVIWVLLNMLLQSSMAYEKDVLAKSMYKFYVTWAHMKPNDMK